MGECPLLIVVERASLAIEAAPDLAWQREDEGGLDYRSKIIIERMKNSELVDYGHAYSRSIL